MQHKSTELMEKIIDSINKEYSSSGRSPSYQELSVELNVSKACISKYIAEMINNGMLNNIGGYRGLKTNNMSKMDQDIIQVPVVGSISCGPLLLAEQNIEYYVPILKSLLGSGKFYILTANGNSMINAGICNGDKVLVRIQNTAEEGQIVVARIDDEATLKRFFIDRDNKKIRLHPENNKMKDIICDNIEIQGIAVKVIKDLI